MNQPNRELILLPIADLVRSPLNVRKTTPAGGIEELAAMIAAQGLLQNLTVTAVAAAPKRGKKSAHYEVVAGGRRLAALQLLVKNGTFKGTHEVPCLLVEREEAVELSLAENSGREAMHPADQFEAFAALIEAGRSIEDIAARFGVQPVTVQRRLKLANVAPRFMAMYREGELDLDVMMAFALVDDHAQQEAAWDGLQQWQHHAQGVRQALTKTQVSAGHSLAVYVGVSAYEKAGGQVLRDLFSDKGQCYLADMALLQKLAGAKLEKAAAKVRAEGWAWVEVRENLDYAELAVFKRVPPRLRAATAEEQESIDALQAEMKALEAEQEAIDAEEGADPGDERWEAICRREQEIEDALEGIETGREEPDTDMLAKAGAIVTIENGKLRTERGLLTAAEIKKQQRENAGTAGDTPPDSSAHSESMMRRLTAHRTRALQVEVARRPDVALVAVVHALVVSVLYAHPYIKTLHVSASEAALAAHAPDLEDSAAELAMVAERDRWLQLLPDDAEDAFAWLATQPQDVLLALLAYCAANTINAVRFHESTSEADDLAAAVGLDMHNWWKPTAEAYFSGLPKARIVDCLEEMGVTGEALASAAKAKKGELANTAAGAAETGGWQWLPQPLRGHVA